MNWFVCLLIISCLALTVIDALPADRRRQQGACIDKKTIGKELTFPEKLPTPKNTKWIQKLQEVLLLEKKSYAQYSADAVKYNACRPYKMVIPQEKYHIQLIEKLFMAYGLKVEEKTEKTEKTDSFEQAIELSIKLEKDLISRYSWLIQNVEDNDSEIVLNYILLETRRHLIMFERAIRMEERARGIS